MTDRPIIFSGQMVRALIDGRKTMTRRLWSTKRYKPDLQNTEGYFRTGRIRHGVEIGQDPTVSFVEYRYEGQDPTRSPFYCKLKYSVGDRLWVRESLAMHGNFGFPLGKMPQIDPVGRRIWSYMADDVADGRTGGKPSIHMPRWASRLTLTVTALKIEPLLDISEADAEAEGMSAGKIDDGFGPRDIGGGWTIESSGAWASAAGHFQILWSKIHPDWDGYSSPEVVAVTFAVEKQNIDDMPQAATA